jgi:hypothetical protein
MKEAFSFEESIKEKISAIRRHPSEKVWSSLHQHLSRRFHPAIHYPAFFLLMLVFSFFFLQISEHTVLIRAAQAFVNNEAVPEAEKIIPDLPENDAQKKMELPAGPPIVAAVTHKKEKYNEFAGSAWMYDYSNNRPIAAINIFPADNNQSNNDAFVYSAAPLYAEKNLAQRFASNDPIHNKTENPSEAGALQFYVGRSLHYSLLRTNDAESGIANRYFTDTGSVQLPSPGVEFGLSFRTPISEKWAIKSGIQVNMSGRNNKTVTQTNDQPILSKTGSPEMVSPSDHLKNQSLSAKRLLNQNFRFSIPIEVEYRLAGNKAMSFFMSGSLQPSFSLYTNGSIITSEFKDQAPVDPYMYRRFNVLTGLECFFRLHAGPFDVQAGPQVRYQLLSNNTGASPYREHIMDYSMKVGIIKKIP